MKLGVTEKMKCDDCTRLKSVVERFEQEKDEINLSQAKRALEAHKNKASKVQRSIRITQKNAETCYANGRIYNKTSLNDELLVKIAQPMQCPMEANLELDKLDTYSFTDLEKECKLHSLKYRKSKTYCIQAIKKALLFYCTWPCSNWIITCECKGRTNLEFKKK